MVRVKASVRAILGLKANSHLPFGQIWAKSHVAMLPLKGKIATAYKYFLSTASPTCYSQSQYFVVYLRYVTNLDFPLTIFA